MNASHLKISVWGFEADLGFRGLTDTKHQDEIFYLLRERKSTNTCKGQEQERD